MHEQIPLADLALRLVAAVVCGGLIGVNRERQNRPAGLRTIMLVALGSGSFVLIGTQLALGVSAEEVARADPTRVLAGLIGGVGFLGAGTIMRTAGTVKGVTTAAALWAAAAAGAACGLGQYAVALLTTALTFMILRLDDFEHTYLRSGERDIEAAERQEDSAKAAERGGGFQP